MVYAGVFGMATNGIFNRENDVVWHNDYVEWNGKRKYYSEIDYCGWGISHHKTIAAVPADAYGYIVRIGDWDIQREHTCSLRLSGKAKQITNEINAEYSSMLNGIIDHVLPMLFKKKALEMVQTGSVKAGAITIGNSFVAIQTSKRREERYPLWEISVEARDGRLLVFQRGKSHAIHSEDLGNTNAALVEPLLEFAKSR